MDKWKSKLFNHCFCYNRNGVVYTSVKGDRKSTNLKWKQANRQFALRIAEDRYRQLYSSDKTVADLKELYEELYISKLKPKRKKNVLYALNTFLSKNFTLSDSVAIREHIIKVKSESHYSNNTLAMYIGTVHHFFELGVEYEYLDKNPIKKSLIPKVVTVKTGFLSDNEVDAILDAIDGEELYRVVKLITLTGMRINEVLSIKEEDILKDHLVIHGKGSKERIFPLKAFPEVRKYLKPADRSYDSLKWELNKALKKTNTKRRNVAFHSFRKYAINSHIISGMQLNIASQIFGHTIKVMEKHYLEALKSQKLNETIINQKKSAQ